MQAYTDYPFAELGDEEFKAAPVRPVEVISYDDNKYCKVIVEGILCEVKRGYLYKTPNRCGEVDCLSENDLVGITQ